MHKKWIVLSLIAAFATTSCFLNVNNINIPSGPEPLEEKTVMGDGHDKIVLMDLTGVISDEERSQTFTTMPSLVAEMKEALDKAAGDARVRAVLLRINSPGGTVTASDVIYHELTEFKKRTGKPVVANIMDLGASGGYYVAVSADKIIAHPTAVTGSIGVIMMTVNVQGLLEKIGVSETAIKSGLNKDMGSPFREMTEEERKLFQGIIDDMYNRFVSVVTAGRPKLNEAEVRKLADGRVYTANQALENGLVDRIGYLDDAIKLAAQEAGVVAPRVVTYYRPGSYKNNVYSKMPDGGGTTVNLINMDLRSIVSPGTPQFMYLWTP
jgi:protease IV